MGPSQSLGPGLRERSLLTSSGWELWSGSAAPRWCGERASELKVAAGAGEAASSCELEGRQQQGGGAGKDIDLGAAAPGSKGPRQRTHSSREATTSSATRVEKLYPAS